MVASLVFCLIGGFNVTSASWFETSSSSLVDSLAFVNFSSPLVVASSSSVDPPVLLRFFSSLVVGSATWSVHLLVLCFFNGDFVSKFQIGFQFRVTALLCLAILATPSDVSK